MRQGIVGLTDLLTRTGLVNIDFADLRTIMSGAGYALLGVGRASGRDRAVEAATAAWRVLVSAFFEGRFEHSERAHATDIAITIMTGVTSCSLNWSKKFTLNVQEPARTSRSMNSRLTITPAPSE